MIYIYLLLSIVTLIISGNLFVSGSISIAKNLKVPMMLIGLTVVSIGTSAPEAAVSINAAMRGANTLAISNILGSNIVNILLALGICAIITPCFVNKKTIKFDYPISLFATLLITIFILISKGINRIEGIVLLSIFIVFMIKIILDSKNTNDNDYEDDSIKENHMPLWQGILLTILGIIGVSLGGKYTIINAVSVAKDLNVSNTLIGLTILAIGTSLPEIITTVISAIKKEVDLAIGNVIGSNIFNILFVLSTTSIIKPIQVGNFALIDSLILLFIASVTFLIILKKKSVNRIDGFIMVISYIAYITYISIR